MNGQDSGKRQKDIFEGTTPEIERKDQKKSPDSQYSDRDSSQVPYAHKSSTLPPSPIWLV